MSKDQALPNNSSIINLLEVVTKGFAIVAGALFVVGLLISNIQMMNLGIADFSSLHARNVLVGFLFIPYFSCLVLTLLPIFGSVGLWLRRHQAYDKKSKKVIFLLFICC
jgi:hypothetical protein